MGAGERWASAVKGAVVDASVSLKWLFNDEVGVPQAQALRDNYLADPARFPLFAPSLWRYEVANGLAVAARRSRLEHDLARDALTDLLALGVKMVDPEDLLVLDLALAYGIAVYDAAYLAVAEETGSILWTADRPFYVAVQVLLHLANKPLFSPITLAECWRYKILDSASYNTFPKAETI